MAACNAGRPNRGNDEKEEIMAKRTIWRIVFDAFAEVTMLSLAFAIVAQVIHDNTTWFDVPGWKIFLISFGFLGAGYFITGMLPLLKKEKQVQE